jgi:hypothetical protein
LADRRRARSAIYPLLLALLIALSALAAPGRPQNRLSVQLLLSDGTSAPLELSLDVDAGTPLPSGCGTDDVTLLVGPSEPALRHPDRWVREWPPVARARWALVIAADDGQEPGVRLADPANRPGAHHVVARTIRDRFNDVAYVISGDGGLMTPKGDVGLAIPLRASWSHPSARGACYLTLPKLADQPQVLNSGFDRGLLPAYADVDTEVRAPAHTDLVAAESVPAPVSEQPDQPPAGWRCGPDHPKTNCQAVAVVEATWADSYLQVGLLLAGALISIAADAWLRERPPPAGG